MGQALTEWLFMPCVVMEQCQEMARTVPRPWRRPLTPMRCMALAQENTVVVMWPGSPLGVDERARMKAGGSTEGGYDTKLDPIDVTSPASGERCERAKFLATKIDSNEDDCAVPMDTAESLSPWTQPKAIIPLQESSSSFSAEVPHRNFHIATNEGCGILVNMNVFQCCWRVKADGHQDDRFTLELQEHWPGSATSITSAETQGPRKAALKKWHHVWTNRGHIVGVTSLPETIQELR